MTEHPIKIAGQPKAAPAATEIEIKETIKKNIPSAGNFLPTSSNSGRCFDFRNFIL